jgi:hypothetical protein
VFDVTISWTHNGVVARQAYITNRGVDDIGSFLTATNSFLRAFATMRFSQQRPLQGPHNDAYGELNWTDNGRPRSEPVAFGYACPQWDGAQQRMTLQVQDMR